MLVGGSRIAHLNRTAMLQLNGEHPLVRVDGELRARFARDIAVFHDAVIAASARCLRRLVVLGRDTEQESVSVVPLDSPSNGQRSVLVILSKQTVSESLSVLGFARNHRLTGAETRLLEALVQGRQPVEVADDFGVAISTVRTQISSIRGKTGATSLRALVHQVAVLPPIASTPLQPTTG